MSAQQLILDDIMRTTVSPYEELLAYEYLYSRKGESPFATQRLWRPL